MSSRPHNNNHVEHHTDPHGGGHYNNDYCEDDEDYSDDTSSSSGSDIGVSDVRDILVAFQKIKAEEVAKAAAVQQGGVVPVQPPNYRGIGGNMSGTVPPDPFGPHQQQMMLETTTGRHGGPSPHQGGAPKPIPMNRMQPHPHHNAVTGPSDGAYLHSARSTDSHERFRRKQMAMMQQTRGRRDSGTSSMANSGSIAIVMGSGKNKLPASGLRSSRLSDKLLFATGHPTQYLTAESASYERDLSAAATNNNEPMPEEDDGRSGAGGLDVGGSRSHSPSVQQPDEQQRPHVPKLHLAANHHQHRTGSQQHSAPPTNYSRTSSQAYYNNVDEEFWRDDLERRKQERKERAYREGTRELTFTPRVSGYVPDRVSSVPLSGQGEWQDRLYTEYFYSKMRKKKEAEAKHVESHAREELESFVNECTFQPNTKNIHKQQQHLKSSACYTERDDRTPEETAEFLYRRKISESARLTDPEARRLLAEQRAYEAEQHRKKFDPKVVKPNKAQEKLFGQAAKKQAAHEELVDRVMKQTCPQKEVAAIPQWRLDRMHDEARRREEALEEKREEMLRGVGVPVITKHVSQSKLGEKGENVFERLHSGAVVSCSTPPMSNANNDDLDSLLSDTTRSHTAAQSPAERTPPQRTPKHGDCPDNGLPTASPTTASGSGGTATPAEQRSPRRGGTPVSVVSLDVGLANSRHRSHQHSGHSSPTTSSPPFTTPKQRTPRDFGGSEPPTPRGKS